MFCQNCGAKNDVNSVFCEKCGTKLDKSLGEQDTTSIPKQEDIYSSNNTGYNPSIATDKKTSRPINKKWLILGASIIALLVVFVLIFNTMKKSYEPEQIAEKFFEQMINEDYDGAFNSLGMSEDDFLNKDTFAKYVAYHQLNDVINYQVYDPMDVVDSGTERDAMTKEIVVEYLTSSVPEYYYINMIKTGQKTGLFFDEWKIDSSDFVTSDIELYTTEDAKLYIDDVEVNSQYYVKSTDEYSSGYYLIPNLFLGEYAIRAERDDFQPQEGILDTGWDTVQFYDAFELSDELIESGKEAVYRNLQAIYQALLEQDDFNTIEGIFSTEYSSLEDLQMEYDYLKSSFENENFEVLGINFYEIEVTHYSENMFEVYFTYDIEYKERNWFTEKMEDDVRFDSRTLIFDMDYKDGQWLQRNLGVENLYY